MALWFISWALSAICQNKPRAHGGGQQGEIKANKRATVSQRGGEALQHAHCTPTLPPLFISIRGFCDGGGQLAWTARRPWSWGGPLNQHRVIKLGGEGWGEVRNWGELGVKTRQICLGISSVSVVRKWNRKSTQLALCALLRCACMCVTDRGRERIRILTGVHM